MIEKRRRLVDNAVIIPEMINLLGEGHTVTLTVKGYSMRPFLEHLRDKVLLTSIDPQNVCVGDVVLAEASRSAARKSDRDGAENTDLSGTTKTYVLHRVKHIDGEDVILCGDGNISVEYCKLADIYAKAIAFYRKNRKKPYKIEDKTWRVYSKCWTSLYPIRRYLLYVVRQYKRVF